MESSEHENKEETKKEPLAGKFADAKELEKAYLSLQKKLGEANAVGEDYATRGKKVFGIKEDTKSSLDGDLGELSTSAIHELGVHPEAADAIVAKAAVLPLQKLVNKNKAEVVGLLKNEENQKALSNTFKTEKEKEDFKASYEAGQITAREVQLRIEQGRELPEAGSVAPASPPMDRDAIYAAKEETLFRILDNPNHPYFREGHPDHQKSRDQVFELKNSMGLE